MNTLLALALAIAGTAPTRTTADNMIWIDTPCATHVLSECTVIDTRFQGFGAVADVNVECASIESTPQVPGWLPQEDPDGGELRRVSRLDVNGRSIRFAQCEVPFFINLSYGGWQGWECLVDRIPSKTCP